eukprot:GHVU01177210.1.p1 GENE.GHVU01177210.1~~GHVU01177210.1.p1  ORF type:complete len:120 (-),score=14.42 GHVU01177210.1:245-604(-)
MLVSSILLSSIRHQKQHQRMTASRSTEVDLSTTPSCGDDDHPDAQSSAESDGVWCEYVCVVTCAYPRHERPQTSHSTSPSIAAIGNTRNGTTTFDDDGGSRSDTAELLQHHIVNRSVGT